MILIDSEQLQRLPLFTVVAQTSSLICAFTKKVEIIETLSYCTCTTLRLIPVHVPRIAQGTLLAHGSVILHDDLIFLAIELSAVRI